MECVSPSREDYTRLCVRIASDPALRRDISDRILSNNHVLFENSGAATELAQFFRDPCAVLGQPPLNAVSALA